MQIIYPKIFKYGTGWLIFDAVFGAVFSIGGAGLAYAGMTGLIKTAPMVCAWLGGGFSLAILIITIPCFYVRLTMMQDRLIYRGYFRTLTILRSDIERTLRLRESYGILSIDLKLRGRRFLETVGNFGEDAEAFLAWFDDIPNAEAEEAKTNSEALLANPAFGSDIAAREQTIDRDVRWLNYLRWPCYGAVVWGLIYPHPYVVCLNVLMAVPVVAAMMTCLSRGRWTINESTGSGRLGIGTMMAMGPSTVMALRAFLDDHMTHWQWSLVVALALALCLFGLVAALEWRFQWKLLIILPLYLAYAWGALLYVDTTFDPAEPSLSKVRILEVDDGDKSHELKVSAWGYRQSGNTVSVSRSFIRQAHVGDTICVFVYPGRLKLPWYEIGACPATGS